MEHGTWNPEPETDTAQTSNPKPETRNLELGTRNLEPETWNPKQSNYSCVTGAS